MWPEDPESPIYRARAAHCGEPSTTSRRRSARDEDARVAPAIIGGGGAPILFDGTPLRAQRDTRAAHAGRGQAEPVLFDWEEERAFRTSFSDPSSRRSTAVSQARQGVLRHFAHQAFDANTAADLTAETAR